MVSVCIKIILTGLVIDQRHLMDYQPKKQKTDCILQTLAWHPKAPSFQGSPMDFQCPPTPSQSYLASRPLSPFILSLLPAQLSNFKFWLGGQRYAPSSCVFRKDSHATAAIHGHVLAQLLWNSHNFAKFSPMGVMGPGFWTHSLSQLSQYDDLDLYDFHKYCKF